MDRSIAIYKADALKHSFNKENTLSLRSYLIDKQQLYIKAREKDENTIVRRLYTSLDPVL